jgi:adenosylcobinamide-phosphate synthase
VLLAAGTGALGVRLGPSARHMPEAAMVPPIDPIAGIDDYAFDTMPGVEASPAALRSGVGLVWRSLLLWMLLLLLLSLAGLFG